jgi:NarL family two-component system response regulator LiaR
MAEPNLIRIMLVDDHAVVRSGLAAFLLAFDDLELVGEADSGDRHCCCVSAPGPTWC